MITSFTDTQENRRQDVRTDTIFDVKQLIPSAILAPSAHNTQPWNFSVADSSIDISIAWDRHLTVSDPKCRQLYISLGCAITNLAVAAQHFNQQVTVKYFPRGQGTDLPVARVSVTPSEADPSLIFDDIFPAIAQRRTDRTMYDRQPLTKSELGTLLSANSDFVLLISDQKIMDSLAKLTEQGSESSLSRPDFKLELSQWVRHNWTRQPDGMPGYAMGMPAPISLIGSTMVRLAPIHKQEAPKSRQQLASSSVVAVIASPTDTPLDWIKSGQVIEKLWLEAIATGLAAMPQAAAIEADQDIRERLQQALNTKLHPQAILRIGHSDAGTLRATPRRSLADCIISR